MGTSNSPPAFKNADIDEICIRKEKSEDLVMALAEAKADAIIVKLQCSNSQEKDAEPTLLIAADTAEAIPDRPSSGDQIKDAEPTLLITGDQVAVYEGTIREKPSTVEEARHFIKGYFGGHTATVSSVLITNLKTGFRKGYWDRVEIYFREIPEEIIEKLRDMRSGLPEA